MTKQQKAQLIAEFELFKSSYLNSTKLTEKDFLNELNLLVRVLNHNKEVNRVIKNIGDELKGDQDYSVICYHVSRLEDLARRRYV